MFVNVHTKVPDQTTDDDDGWRTLSPMDRLRSDWLSLANCCRVPNQMTSDFATFSCRAARTDLLSLVSSAKLWNAALFLSPIAWNSDAYVIYRSAPSVEHWILGRWHQMSGSWLWQRMCVQIDSYGTTAGKMMRRSNLYFLFSGYDLVRLDEVSC